MCREFFKVNVKQYSDNLNFEVVRPSSLNYPQNNSVMFLMEKYIADWEKLLSVRECLIFWPQAISLPQRLSEHHAIVCCENTRLEFCNFFKRNNIRNLPVHEKMANINGACVSENATIGDGTVIMPGAYISGQVKTGKNCYIGAGVKLMGQIDMGNNVVIRENSVLGSDGLSTDRDAKGSVVTMPQFGGIKIGDHVDIGANCVIARGAIDDTVICSGCKLDNSVFISHNVHLGKDTLIVGETIMFGSSSTGERAYISGNSSIRNKIRLGSDTIIGMGAVVTKNVEDGKVVLGNPARERV